MVVENKIVMQTDILSHLDSLDCVDIAAEANELRIAMVLTRP